MIRRLAVLTSGDDVPGMNAAIRAITRTALDNGWEVMGIRDGYAGLICGEFEPLTVRSVGGIIQRGGTMLGSLGSKEFLTEAGQNRALNWLVEHDVDAVVVIGGDGSQAGAYALSQRGFCVNGVASSLENDLVGTDIAIGVDTALNITLNTIDHLKNITSSDCYTFLVEVAGRRCGYLAVMSGIAGGAEAIVIPEVDTTPEHIADVIRNSHERGKSHAIIVMAEGAGVSMGDLIRHFTQRDSLSREVRGTTLCQIQHGGAPSAFDRLLGTRLGACAVDALSRGEHGVLAGYVQGEIHTTPLADIVGQTKEIDHDLLRLADVLTL